MEWRMFILTFSDARPQTDVMYCIVVNRHEREPGNDLPGSMAFRLLSFGRGRPFICRGVFNPRSAHDAGSASCDLASGRRLLFLAGGFQPPERLEDACFLPPGGFQPPERLQDARRNDIQAGAFSARLPNGRFIGSACHSLNSPL